MRRTAIVLAAFVALIICDARAQGRITAAAKCDRVDTTANWYHRQAEWWALETKHDWTDDSLRTKLLSVVSLLSPPGRDPFPIQVGGSSDHGVTVATLPVDQLRELLPSMRQLLRDMAQKRSWPLRSTVGPAGVRAAWLIASGDSALTNTAMHRMMEAGPGEVSPTDVAVLEDELRIMTGRKQIYGTQLHDVTGPGGRSSLQPLPTEDLAHVDLRRDAAALPPLPYALCRAARQPRM